MNIGFKQKQSDELLYYLNFANKDEIPLYSLVVGESKVNSGIGGYQGINRYSNVSGVLKTITERSFYTKQQLLEFISSYNLFTHTIIDNYISYNKSSNILYKYLNSYLIAPYISKVKSGIYEMYIGLGTIIVTKINDNSVFVPLVVSTINRKHIDYYINCYEFNELYKEKVINVYLSDELVNSKSKDFKNLRMAFKKYVLPSILDNNIILKDNLDDLYKLPKLPKFSSIAEKKAFLLDLENKVKASIRGEKEKSKIPLEVKAVPVSSYSSADSFAYIEPSNDNDDLAF